MINNDSNEFLDDIMIYNHCGMCKNYLNKFFCKNCYENICVKCYEKCKIKKHDFIDLAEMKEKSNSFYIKIIKFFLINNIIQLKGDDENSINEENNLDILLIIEIISQDYTNFFHLENIVRILRYINFFYKNLNEKYKEFENWLVKMVIII